MNFIPLASSSRGNAYLVTSEGVAPLLIEAGVPIKQLREKLREHGVSVTDLAGCLVSHEHMDHAKAVKDLLKAGVDCYMSEGTAKAIEVFYAHRTWILNAGRIQTIQQDGRWRILPFALEHDAADPLGFLVANGSDYANGDDHLLFIPDTCFMKQRFLGVTILCVECNHIEDILSAIIQSGLPAVVGRRVRRNHMALGTLIKMIKANDLSRCRQIWLLHLSDGNSDEARMIREVQEATGIVTRAA